QRQRGTFQYEKMGQTRFEKIISEGGLSFKVNLSDYLDTGLFIDRRLLRAMIRTEAAGKKLLNLFSYTGAFSVYAAAGGAVSTDSVDLSNTYLNWSRENFSLNGMSAQLIQMWDFLSNNSANKLIRADVLEFLEKAITAKKRWDIIVLDPPAFSNSKKMTDNLDIKRDLIVLLDKCLKLLTPDGKIFLSLNIRSGAPKPEELEAELKNTCVIDLEKMIIDEDYKGRKIPKTFCVKRI
ncbi:MAG: class I SAM-dependent methyltransferase, partial [Treponema sp.]|nr:class I SAM-dependent methyltransferase [Treponema sp.]